MAYCETRIQQSAPGSSEHAVYSRLLRKGQVLEAQDSFRLAQMAFSETFRQMTA